MGGYRTGCDPVLGVVGWAGGLGSVTKQPHNKKKKTTGPIPTPKKPMAGKLQTRAHELGKKAMAKKLMEGKRCCGRGKGGPEMWETTPGKK